MTRPRAAITRAAAALLLTACGDDPAPVAQTSAAAPSTSSTAPRGGPSSSTTSTAAEPEGRPTAPKGTPGRPRGGVVDPRDVDDAKASEVAQAYARTTSTIDTRIDRSYSDAQRRATRWLDPKIAKELEQDLPADPSWSQLAKDQAWTTARTQDVSPDGSAPTGLNASRVIEVTVTTKGAGGKSIGKPDTVTMLVDLARAGTTKPWLVTAVSTY
ncbi:hypothetical protein [Janibacter melonis]|uniref:hypothetical protein n=1 Tax=Janibacter melonis TaxID=262209 RepID=UPI00174E3943|nr:hypothetical protein [Janibacter melonis]